MTWVRFDDQVDDHPKIAGLSDQAFRWWFRAFCYSGRYLLDGVLPQAFLVRVPKKAHAELVVAGLWEDCSGVFHVHDYHDYQPTKAKVQEKRNAAKERMERAREVRANTNGTGDALPAKFSIGSPNPIPSHPDPKEQMQTTHTAPARGVQGPGAFELGSLPRDHAKHALCGPKFRLCLSYPVFGSLAGKYGGTQDEAREALADFVARLEASVGDDALGDHLWLLNHFDAWLVQLGRVPPAPSPTRSKGDNFDGMKEFVRNG